MRYRRLQRGGALVHDKRFIPISAPSFGEREAEYVRECLESTWISSRGQYIERFEREFAVVCGAAHAVACNTGTAALHLAMLALGIGPGDEVIVPTLTYVASANAVRYTGATVRFVDSDPETWNLDPADVERKIGPRTRAILAVHLYGEPAGLDPLLEIAEAHGIDLIEDAAEAHTASYQGRPVGALGTIGTFSFYGNKIITTGEGGMVVTNDAALAERATLFRGQGQAFDRLYWFPVIGYNYRMTNIEAAIGLAQLDGLKERLSRRRDIAARYRANLDRRSRPPSSRGQPRDREAPTGWWGPSSLCAQPRSATVSPRCSSSGGSRPVPSSIPFTPCPPTLMRRRAGSRSRRSFPLGESASQPGQA